MNTNRLLIGLVIALVVAFLLSSFVYKQFQKASIVKPSDTQSLVVASVPLPLGARLDATNLKVIQWPANQQVAGMFTRIEDCTNRAVITPLAANEPVLESKLAPKESGAGLAATIPEGMRAVSVAVNEVVGVAGFVTPGTMVDVLVTGRALGGGAAGQGDITRTILENIRVLAAGQKIEQDREGKPQTVAVITLLVTPDEASQLTMGATDGKIQLALRNTIDTKKNEPKAIVQAALFSPQGAVSTPVQTRVPGRKAAPAVPPPYVIEVITGNKRENKSFPNSGSSSEKQ
ncbi:MAG TPA: Flp pilus assembly protein CpaB [Candidatus Eisenbacteria bacterium]|jgi:pilus assembly protein CpaB|nr:Flp pilus assembly protein CpaB [Candidatus Eisenbacteria bacterium]